MAGVKLALLRALSIAFLAFAWEVAARVGWVDPAFIPTPSSVASVFLPTFQQALPRLVDTLSKTLLAYLCAVTVGVTMGLVIGSMRYLHDVLNPFVVALYSTPKILILPWIVLWTGIGTKAAVVYGAVHGFFPVLILVVGGVRDVDRHPIMVAKSMGAGPWQIYWKVVLPTSLPSVLEGMRLGIVYCLLGVLVVEMFAGVRGTGYLLQSLGNAFRAPELFAATALVSIASIAIVLGLDVLNKRLGAWR
jgi:ABC-type nitrate/sulfonate/bicarbonate transport system permease component